MEVVFEKPIKDLVAHLPFGAFLSDFEKQQYADLWSRYIQKKLLKTVKSHLKASGLEYGVFVDMYDLNFEPKTRPNARFKILSAYLPAVIVSEADKFGLMLTAKLNQNSQTTLKFIQKSLRLLPETERKKIFKKIKSCRKQKPSEVALMLHETLTAPHITMPDDFDAKMDFVLRHPYAIHIETDNREIKFLDRLENASQLISHLLEDDFRHFGAVVCRPDSREDVKNRAMRAHRILMNDVADKEYNAHDLRNKVLARPAEISDLNDKQINLILGDMQPLKIDNQTTKSLRRIFYRLRETHNKQ